MSLREKEKIWSITVWSHFHVYMYLPKLAIPLVERGLLLALIPLGVAMDKAEIHEMTRYPERPLVDVHCAHGVPVRYEPTLGATDYRAHGSIIECSI